MVGICLSLLWVFGCTDSERLPPGLSGAISNHDGVTVELTYFQEYFNNNRVVIGIEPDKHGIFVTPLDLGHTLEAGLRVGRTEVSLYLRPDDALYLEFDASRPFESMTYSGQGAGNNQFLLNFHRHVMLETGDRFVMTEAGSRDPASFVSLLDSIAAVREAFLKRGLDEHDLSADFVAYMETRIVYDRYTRLLDYPVMFSRMDPSEPLPNLPQGYYDFLTADDIQDDSHLDNLAYVNFLMAWLNHERRQRPDGPSHEGQSLNAQTFLLAGEVLSGKSRDYIQAMMVGRELGYGVMADAMGLYNKFVDGNAHESFKLRIQQIYNHMQTLFSGKPAPDFAMTDIEGREVSLSDFRGKVVLMDFWASWCGPCMREMPYVKELKQKFAEVDDLVFMYISIDTDVDAWAAAVERLDLEGVHFNTPGRERGVPLMYNVKWIPTFYLIGRDGNIYDNRPPLPSQGGFAELVAEALEAKE